MKITVMLNEHVKYDLRPNFPFIISGGEKSLEVSPISQSTLFSNIFSPNHLFISLIYSPPLKEYPL